MTLNCFSPYFFPRSSLPGEVEATLVILSTTFACARVSHAIAETCVVVGSCVFARLVLKSHYSELIRSSRERSTRTCLSHISLKHISTSQCRVTRKLTEYISRWVSEVCRYFEISTRQSLLSIVNKWYHVFSVLWQNSSVRAFSRCTNTTTTCCFQ